MCPSGSGSSELQNFVEARCGGLVTCTFVPSYQGSSTILLSHSLLTCHPFLDRADTRPERLCCCYNSIWGFFDTYTSTSLEKQIPKTFSLHHFSFAYKDKKRAFIRKPATAYFGKGRQKTSANRKDCESGMELTCWQTPNIAQHS